MFEMTSRCSPTASYEHTCGTVPNRLPEARYIAASFPRWAISGQLVFTTTGLSILDKIGSVLERMISMG